MPIDWSSPRVCRVSSAAITSADASASCARGLRSRRFPIGVATTSSRPRELPTIILSMPNTRSLSLLALLAALVLVASCQSLGPRGEPPPSVDRARALDRSGDYAGAARIYEALAAQNTGTEQNGYLLLAARSYLQARRADDAQRVLASIAPPLSPDQTFERQMLDVDLALARNQPNDAWQRI